MKLTPLIATLIFVASASAEELYVSQPTFPIDPPHKELEFEGTSDTATSLEQKMQHEKIINPEREKLTLSQDGKLKTTKNSAKKD